jgi:exodeoxyribonuclease-3
MIIASYNVNGLRAALRKGFLEWADASRADVICLQEVRATGDQIDTVSLAEAGWFFEFFPAEKAGYAGTGILSRERLSQVRRGTGMKSSDQEGRVISAEVGGVRFYSVYAPSGGSGEVRQKFKMEWLLHFSEFWKREIKNRETGLAFCGDFNICHQENDIHNPEGLSGVSGFLPEEREWFSEWMRAGGTDSFRTLNPLLIQYSWWSQRGNARGKNLGWRIDYIITCPILSPATKRVWIDEEAVCSDHCPVLAEIDV